MRADHVPWLSPQVSIAGGRDNSEPEKLELRRMPPRHGPRNGAAPALTRCLTPTLTRCPTLTLPRTLALALTLALTLTLTRCRRPVLVGRDESLKEPAAASAPTVGDASTAAPFAGFPQLLHAIQRVPPRPGPTPNREPNPRLSPRP